MMTPLHVVLCARNTNLTQLDLWCVSVIPTAARHVLPSKAEHSVLYNNLKKRTLIFALNVYFYRLSILI
jgi:hypothetical protein